MKSTIAAYEIEELNESFKFEQTTCEKTVVVKTFLENKLVSQNKYGVVPKESIYDLLKSGESIDLSHCYVKDFSITEYKKRIGLEEYVQIEVERFIAESAFFDCDLGSDFSCIHFKGKVTFENSVFSHGNVSFYQCRFSEGNDVNFKNVVFGKGEISFQYVEIGINNVFFDAAKFYGGAVLFVNASFGNGNVSFKSVDFYNCKVKFHYAKFGDGNVIFQKAKFGNRTIDFRRVEFESGRVDFRRASFGDGYVTFDESEVKDGKFNFRFARFGSNDVSFKKVNFGQAEVLFEHVSFGTGKVYFSDSSFSYVSFRGSHLDVFLDLTVRKADVIDLSDTVIRDIVDLKFLNNRADIKTLYLNDMRNLGRIIIDWRQNNAKQLIKSQKSTSTTRQKSEQFNVLKENFGINGQYEDEDAAYIQFKRYDLISDYKSDVKKGGINLFKLPYHAFRWTIFDKMGLYATSPLRVLFSMIVIYILFSLSYLVLPLFDAGGIVNSVGATDGLNYIQTCFYHSAITFLTIGYGDFYPTGFSRGISVVEGWTGLFLMSYFTVAFVRKILR